MTKLTILATTIFFSIFALPVHSAQPRVLHDGNWTFLFGNHLDTHQDSRLRNDGTLQGRIYIIPKVLTSGETVWVHPRGGAQGEQCGVDVDCTVGWTFTAYPGDAKFLFHSGVNGNDHAAWLVNRVDIQQPGSHNHFHWVANVGPDGITTDNRLVPDACNKVNAGALESDAVNVSCPGWFVELRAVRSFTFEHGGEKIVIRPGVDNSSHLNLLTNFNNEVSITSTR